jgi:tetratricopeptide (TPR) repeat protein
MITLARVELLGIAKTAKQEEKQLKLLKLIAFSSPASEANKGHSANAKRELAQIQIWNDALGEALTTLSSLYEGPELSRQIYELAAGPIGNWCGDEKTKSNGMKLADTVISMLMKSVPDDLADEKSRPLARDLYYRMAGVYHHSGRPQEILKTYETMSKLFGSDDEILGKMAEFHKGQKQRDKARAIYAKMENQIGGQSEIAKMWREEDQYDKAIEIYRALMVKDGAKSADYLAAIAECYESSSRFALAIQTYRQVDRFPSTHFAMARCHRKLKQYSEAITLYGQAKADQASAPDAALEIGYTHEEDGKTEAAIKAFQQTCKGYPTSSQASQAHAHLQDKYKITVTLGGAKE